MKKRVHSRGKSARLKNVISQNRYNEAVSSMPLSSMTDIPIVEEGGDVTDVVQEKRDYYLAVSHNQLNLDHEVYNNQSMGTISAWKPLNTQSNVIIPNKKQRVQTAKCGHRRVISLDYQ